jgi:predicted GNAT family acetyltransferase
MASTKVEIRDNRELRRVEALDGDGQVAGFAQYQISVDGSTFDFNHTEVDERYEGQGIGSQLAAGVMEFARGEGITIEPSCSFIRSYMDKHEETNDLRAPEPSDESDEDNEDNEDGDDSDGQSDGQSDDQSNEKDDEDQDQDDQGDQDDEDGEDEDDSVDEDSPDAGPADAKAAGSGGATDEEDSRA